MLNLQRLRVLTELARRGTLTEVAAALSFSRSSVSQQLAQLEIEAGVALLEPVGRRVRLTAAGEILVRHAEQILRQIDHAEADLAATRSTIAGELKIATFQTAALTLVPELLTRMAERHPALTLHLSEIQPDAGAAALLAGEFDLVLGERYPGIGLPRIRSDLHRTSLLSDPLRLWVGDHSHGNGRELADFADADWIFEPRDKPARAWAEALCRAAGFTPRVRFESADLLVHARLVETGHAVALLPDLLWRARPAPSRSVPLPTEPHREVFTAVRGGAQTRPVLVELRRTLADVVDTGAVRD